MAESLPERPDLSWLRKRAKAERTAGMKLAEAQLAVARRYGFANWRALVACVVDLRAAATAPRAFAEPVVAKLLRHVGRGEADAVVAMLRDEPALVNAVGPHPFWGGRPQALHVAIDAGRDDMVKLVSSAGADVDGTNDEYSHWSPLLIAIVKGRTAAKRMLIRRGARVGLVEALAMGDDERVLRMLRRGRAALPTIVPSDGSLLSFARTPAAIDRLLALGVSIDRKDRWGAGPVDALSRLGKRGAALVRHLASRGIAVDAEAFGRLGDRRSLARLIADDPELPTRPTVIAAAAEHGHRAVVAWLIDRGADPNARSAATSRATCLHSAAWRGDLAMVELLLERGADPGLLDDEHHNTPAGWADIAMTATNNHACADVAKRLREAERRA